MMFAPRGRGAAAAERAGGELAGSPSGLAARPHAERSSGWREGVARGLLVLAVLVPGNAVSIALLLHSSRLPLLWRLPFVSELMVVGVEAVALRTGVLLQACIMVTLGSLAFSAQTKRARLACGLPCEEEAAPTRPGPPGAPRPWGALLQLQWLGTVLAAVGLVLLPWFDLFSSLVSHLALVLFTFNSGTIWLCADTVFEVALARVSAKSLAPTGVPAAPSHPGPLAEELLLPVQAADKVIGRLLGQLRQDRLLFWLKLRAVGVGLGVLSLNVMVLAGASAMRSPFNVFEAMEHYVYRGAVVEDPQFPLAALSTCAVCEWVLVVALPALFLLSFWDAFAPAEAVCLGRGEGDGRQMACQPCTGQPSSRGPYVRRSVHAQDGDVAP